jgi:uncharacterized ferritin-like protein (DUF455 family)
MSVLGVDLPRIVGLRETMNTERQPKPHNPADSPPAAGQPCPPASLRETALHLLLIRVTQDKAAAVLATDSTALPVGATSLLAEPPGVPGRPDKPPLVHPRELQNRAVGTLAGRASLIHALAHIEANAINLALDIVWRFPALPEAFYRDWWQVAHEEALHFSLLEAHLRSLGYAYGDFPAHDGLWDMASQTRGDLLARLALVPRTLEARGLDATPAIQNKLVSVGDRAGAAILDIILRDEIGHVATGNRWYLWLCQQRGLDPLSSYSQLARQHGAPTLKGPFNLPARRAAGFSEAELAVLCGTPEPV